MRSFNKLKIKSLSKRFLYSVWLFPAVLAIVLILLTILRISGTSEGIYYPFFYGNNAKDSNLLFNKPKAIRSDEWLVGTQLTIAQSVAGYPRINHNIFNGTDMSVIGDAPYKDWSAAFKPQNLIFFVLPLENAFAFKWWLILFLTIIGGYFVVLRFFSGKRLIAAMLATAIGCSPFLFWWYETGTFAPVFYGFFMLLLGWRIINGEKAAFLKKYPLKYSQVIYLLLLSYVLISFALILYPPFQIPVIITVAAFLLGYFLQKHLVKGKKFFSRISLTQLGVFIVSGLIAGSVGLIFIHTRSSVISSIKDTVYPGARIEKGGNYSPVNLLSSYLQPQLQRTSKANQYYTNQSEASDFLMFVPFLILPGFLLLWLEYKQKRKLDWPLLAIQLCITLFLANLFISSPLRVLYKITFLDQIPATRLLLGLGFVGVLQLLYVSKVLLEIKITKRKLTVLAGLYTLLCLGVLLWAGRLTRLRYPHFISSWPLIIGFAVFFSALLFCFLSRRILIGSVLILLFTGGTVFKIHPIYRGLDIITNNKVIQAIDSVSKPQDTWVMVDNGVIENFGFLSNRNSISGVQLYPNLSFWRQIEGPKGDSVYNRYAHIIFDDSPSFTNKIKLVQTDEFQVEFTCNSFIEKNVQFALNVQPMKESCVKLVDTVQYPAISFYLYKLDF